VELTLHCAPCSTKGPSQCGPAGAEVCNVPQGGGDASPCNHYSGRMLTRSQRQSARRNLNSRGCWTGLSQHCLVSVRQLIRLQLKLSQAPGAAGCNRRAWGFQLKRNSPSPFKRQCRTPFTDASGAPLRNETSVFVYPATQLWFLSWRYTLRFFHRQTDRPNQRVMRFVHNV